MRTLTDFYEEIRLEIADKSDGTVETADMTKCLNRALRKRQNQDDFLTVKNRTILEVYDSVYEYAKPTGFKRFVDLYNQNQRIETDLVTPDQFWDNLHDEKDTIQLSVDAINGSRMLLVKNIKKSSILLSSLTSITENGTWTASGDANSLFEDTINYSYGNGSLRFKITPSTNVATITNSNFSAANLTEYEGLAAFFLWVYLPTVTNITSITIKIGSDASNYLIKTLTTQFSGNNLAIGENTIGFKWEDATEVGTVNVASIKYAQISINHTLVAETSGFRANYLRCATSTPYKLHYYTNNIIKTSTNTYQEKFIDDSDTTIWEENFDDIILKDCVTDIFHKILNEPNKAEISRTEGEDLMQKALAKEPADSKWVQSEQ